jgi:serine phosphatase RsbU (regulator of sigma subunit)
LNETARVAAYVVVLVGGLVLAGWLLRIAALRSVVPGLVAMNPVTALAFIVGSVALRLREPRKGGTRRDRRRSLAIAGAVSVALVGLITLVGYVIGSDLGIDQVLFRDQLAGNRVAPNTGLNFLLVGLALALIEVEARKSVRPAQILALATTAIALISLVGYAYGVGALYGFTSYIPMALNTALAFALLAVGVLCARPNQGIMTVLSSESAGGVTLRRLVPAAVAIPALLGWLSLVGQRIGAYNAAFGISLVVVVNVVVFAALIWAVAHSLDRADAERRRAEAERERQRGEAERLREERRRQLEEELARAARVQADLLPREVPALPGFELAARCLPAREVGGDFFDWHETAPGLLTLTLGDVMGKGMPAALLMATVRAALEAVARQSPPAPAIQTVAAALERDLDRSGSFITLFHARANAATRSVEFVDAGHGHAFLRRVDGRVEALEPRGLPLGIQAEEAYQTGSVCLAPGDVMVVYSDGFLDARPDVLLTPDRAAAELRGAASALEIVDRLVALATPDGPLPDDLTLVVLRCRDEAPVER